MTSLDDAHAALLRNDALQFDLKAAASEAPTPPHRDWGWRWSGHFDPTVTVGIVVGIVALVIVVLAVAAVRKRRRPASEVTPAVMPPDGPVPAQAVQLALRDADAQAAAGRYLEAARVLLACGVAAIGRGHPEVLRPAMTDRDIARMAGLPSRMRTAFRRIADIVELGLFAGYPIEEHHYAECRTAFVGSGLAETR